MTAVCDASPLILLARIDRLDLLAEAFTTVLVPPAVWREVVDVGARPGATAIAEATWIQRRSVASSLRDIEETARLGAGEREAITLAREFAGSIPLLLDDLKGRRVALDLGLPVVGTAGVLVAAKDLGLVEAVRPLLEDLQIAGLRLSDRAYDEVIRIAGEEPDDREYR